MNNQVAARVRTARLAAGLTLQQLAEKTGYHVTSLSSFETGRRRLKLDQLYQIAAALGRSPASFFAPSNEIARVIDIVVHDEERALQVQLFLETLNDELPSAPDG